jgi:hypothetical protein
MVVMMTTRCRTPIALSPSPAMHNAAFQVIHIMMRM